jgi:carbonic anhydrase
MSLSHLFDKNRQWAHEINERSPGFFTRLQQQQSPQYLWIGCSDSRVPANEIVGLLPGELFVHRNVANVVVHSDLNCLSVMEFAIDALQVQHVMVVGHYGCSGVNAAMNGVHIGIADNWLRHVQDVHIRHQAFLDQIKDESIRLDAMCELNVLEQALNVCRTTVVQEAWAKGHAVQVHGWVYGLRSGLLEDLSMSVDQPADVAKAYASALEKLKTRYSQLAIAGGVAK